MKKINIFLLSLFTGIFFLFFVYFIPVSLSDESVVIDVPPGKTFYQMAKELKEKELIRSNFAFKVLIRLSGTSVLQVGEYELKFRESLFSQFQKIKKGKVYYKWVTFPEGFNHYEIWKTLKEEDWPEADRFLNLVWDKKFVQSLIGESLNSLEGYLFPETYGINKYSKAETLLKEMVQNFLKAAEKLKSEKNPFTRHQWVTFASLIEKETGLASERPLISSVFHNRLKKKMKLQTDPTILYGMYLERGFSTEKNIRKHDILKPTTYNTYVIRGLPPGPIASPGKEALRAVLKPATSEYLYFVSRNDGSHVFSKTYEEHKSFVYKYQIKAFEK